MSCPTLCLSSAVPIESTIYAQRRSLKRTGGSLLLLSLGGVRRLLPVMPVLGATSARSSSAAPSIESAIAASPPSTPPPPPVATSARAASAPAASSARSTAAASCVEAAACGCSALCRFGLWCGEDGGCGVGLERDGDVDGRVLPPLRDGRQARQQRQVVVDQHLRARPNVDTEQRRRERRQRQHGGRQGGGGGLRKGSSGAAARGCVVCVGCSHQLVCEACWPAVGWHVSRQLQRQLDGDGDGGAESVQSDERQSLLDQQAVCASQQHTALPTGGDVYVALLSGCAYRSAFHEAVCAHDTTRRGVSTTAVQAVA